jgi:hypothetical protein
MFLVRNGRDSFYSPTWTSARYRCDAGCMTSCDARAAEVVRYFEWLLAHAAVYEWVGESRLPFRGRPFIAPYDHEALWLKAKVFLNRALVSSLSLAMGLTPF